MARPSHRRTLSRSRRETAAKIRRMREEQGRSFAQIAANVGLATSTAREYHRDPDGSKARARRRRYAGTCGRCGGETFGGRGRENAPAICRDCRYAEMRAWPAERVLGSIRETARRLGRTPTVGDFSPAHARASGDRPRPAPQGGRPDASTIARRFGSFREAVRAAGLEPAPGGKRRQWSPEAIIRALQRDAAARGHYPRASDWERAGPGHPTRAAVSNAFRSFERAVEQARTEEP